MEEVIADYHWLPKKRIFCLFINSSYYDFLHLYHKVNLFPNNHSSRFTRSDDHQFSPLHWAAKGGHTKIVEMLIARGARIHTTNMGDDTPLHLAAAHGHRPIVNMVCAR